MAFLSAKEFKALRGVGLVARVAYIFFQKPRMSADGVVELSEEDFQAELDGVVLDAGADPEVLDIPAIEDLIDTMVADQLLSPTDVRKIKNLLYLH